MIKVSKVHATKNFAISFNKYYRTIRYPVDTRFDSIFSCLYEISLGWIWFDVWTTGAPKGDKSSNE